MTWGPPPPDQPWTPTGPPGTAAQSPGESPTAPRAEAWYPDGRRPEGPPATTSPPPAPPSGGRRRVLVAGVVGGLVLVLGVVIGIVATSGDDRPTAGPTAPAVAPSSSQAPAPSDPASATTGTTPAPTTAAASTSAFAGPSQDYRGPGGVTVTGPAGWVPDTTAGIANIADYRAPSSSNRLTGPTFRLGIGNPNPGTDFGSEVQQSVAFLQSQYGATVLGTSSPMFLGVVAADIEYTYYNADLGVQRHGIERIWRSGGITLIIQSSDVAANWPAASAVFDQLVRTATTS